MENNIQKRRRYQKDSAPADDIVTLIHLVRQNPTLYNYKLQPNQRRRIDILNGWAQIAAAIGNKYTVEECRRKWKNLRDTYHQYRLRKPKMGDGLSKWRYAKDMEFLSNVYQPKLKSNRTQTYNTTPDSLLQSVTESMVYQKDEHDQVVSEDMVHMVNETDTFILTAYEDVTHDNDVSHEDRITHRDLNHEDHSMDDCVEIVKAEQHATLHDEEEDDEDDGNTGADVDYEEVCLYEESGNAPSVDCETIIGGGHGNNSANSDDNKFHYLDTNDYCIGSINPSRSQYSSSASSVIGAPNTIKLKNLPMVSSSTTSMPSTSSTHLDPTSQCVTISSPSVHIQTLPELRPCLSTKPSPMATSSACTNEIKPDSNSLLTSSSTIAQPTYCNTSPSSSNHQREECDLFFDFLKKKIQRFPREEMTAIQVEFLNCVLRREAEQAQKAQQQQNHHTMN